MSFYKKWLKQANALRYLPVTYTIRSQGTNWNNNNNNNLNNNNINTGIITKFGIRPIRNQTPNYIWALRKK